MKVAVILFALVALAAATAPLYHAGLPTTVQDQYIVVLNENTTEEMRDSHASLLEAAGHTLRHKFHIGDLIGFSINMDKEALVAELEHPDVKYIEADGIVTIVEDIVTQPGATWGIDRIDQRALPLSTTYSYWASAGSGVDAYIIDTGINTVHNDFQGRAVFGANFVAGETGNDCNGHGTHVASTTAGFTWGVAKRATLFAVKVLGCQGSGTWDGVIAGINWVTASHQSRPSKKSVANMSLGGGLSTTVNAAVANSITAGVHYAIAAGNNNGNACSYSPASVLTANTIGATTNTDARASFSNWGTCVKLFAPGNAITAAWIGSQTATNTISGTSMAAPHVCGAVALYLGHQPADSIPPSTGDVTSWLTRTATPGVVTNPGTGSPNLLLYSLSD